MTSKIICRLIIIVFVLLLSCGILAPVSSTTLKPIVIVVEPKGKKMIYKVDGRQLTADQLVDDHLKRVPHAQRSKNRIIIIASTENTIDNIMLLRNLLDKMDFDNVRYYAFVKEYGIMMEEFKFGIHTSIPFTTNPDAFE